MKDAGFPLQTAYYSLTENLSYEDEQLAFYSVMAPDKAPKPYVIIGPWITRGNNTKYTFGEKGEITLDIVTEFIGADWSRKPASDIADSILELLFPTPATCGLMIEGFRLVVSKVESVQDLDLQTDHGTLVRKLITVTHHLTQV